MPCKIYLRRDQSGCLRQHYSVAECATIFAPLWVKQALEVLGQHLKGVTFEVYESSPFSSPLPLESFTISEDFNQQSLQVLQKIARNEPRNVTGVINTNLYPDIKDRKVLYSIRDLVRQCVIVAADQCATCGGYKCPKETQQTQNVYICDLAALQFQQPYNSGRLVLLQEQEPHKAILDDLIYENVVGEKKLTYSAISDLMKSSNVPDEIKKRYLPHDGYGLPGRMSCFIDTKAYKKFVANDVILSGLAISEMAFKKGDKICFKFLKYGTGFFAWKFAMQLDRIILSGVLDGLEELFGRNEQNIQNTIKCIELPFFKEDPTSTKRISKFHENYGVKILFGNNDALKQCQSPDKGLIMATTNCGDNHAPCGNEMHFASVDAAISENLFSKGNLLCPNINTRMSERYLDFL